MVGILIAFLVLLIGFGSVIVGILPLVAAIAGVAVTNLALLALTPVVNESSTTSILATMIGLAVGIDYSLFVLNRYRQQLVEGVERDRVDRPSAWPPRARRCALPARPCSSPWPP